MKSPEYSDIPEQNLPTVIIRENAEEKAKRIELEAQAAREKAQRREQTMVRRITPEMQKRIDAANAVGQFPAPLASTDEVPQSIGFYESARPLRPSQKSKIGYIIGSIAGALTIAAGITIATLSKQKVQPTLSSNNSVPAETVAALTTVTSKAATAVAPIETNLAPAAPTTQSSIEINLPEDIPSTKPSSKPATVLTNKPWPKPPVKPKGDGIMREVPF